MTDEPGDFYTRSDNSRVRVRDMAYPHLVSAHAKLVRDHPDHSEIAGMAREIARRNAALADFSNRLRILTSIDRDELVKAKAIPPNDIEAWLDFSRDPLRWFIKVSDLSTARVWAIIEARSK